MKAYQISKLIINGPGEYIVTIPRVFIDNEEAVEWASKEFGDKYWWKITEVDLELPQLVMSALHEMSNIPKEHEAILFLNRFRLYI